MKLLKKSTYQQTLIIILSLLLTLFCVPFAFTLYSSSKSRILDAQQAANNQNLQQIKYNYDIYQDMISNLCFSIYLDNGTQSLLYNPNITSKEAYEQIDYFNSSVLNVYPSVYSITIYNGIQKKYYSTLMDSTEYLSSITDLFSGESMPPKLKPILRRIPNETGTGELYVYTYLIYDFESSSDSSASFIIVEQNANWLIDNFTQIRSVNESIPSEIYLLDNEGNIFSQNPDTISQDSSEILENFFADHAESGEQEMNDDVHSITYSYKGERYLITQLSLTNQDSLVMLQNYNDVFANIESFKHTFAVVIIIWVILFAMAIWGISKKLYAPVQKMLKYVNGLSGQTPETGNEFQQLMNLYKDSYDKLTNHNHAAHYVITQYQLEKLLVDSTKNVWNNFIAYTPDHWLSEASNMPLRVFHLTMDSQKADGSIWSDDDFRLYLFATQNILSELLKKDRNSEVFMTSDYSIWGIIQAKGEGRDANLETILVQTQDYVKKYLAVHFNVSYSGIALQPTDITRLYHETLTLHDYHYVYGPDAVISPDTCKVNLANDNDHLPDHLVKKCLSAIKIGNLESAVPSIHEIFHALQEMRYENIQISIMALANQINFTLKELCNSKGVLTKIRFEWIYSQIDMAHYLQDVQKSMLDYLDDTLRIFQVKTDQDKEHLFIQSIQNYIASNYSDPNLSSQLIGEQFHLSSKYLMKRFLNYSGISLNEYILEVRMHQAAVLLKNSDYAIGKIAASVGILNENYFYKLFKKFYGCTPREYSIQQRKSEK